MTPLQIIDEEICTKCQSIKYYHKSFQDALFRPEETASSFQKEYGILTAVRVQSAKGLIQRQIEQIRLLQMIKGRMQTAAKAQRKTAKGRRQYGIESQESLETRLRRETSQSI